MKYLRSDNKTYRKRKKRRSITLVEIWAIMSILGIMTVIALPSIISIKNKKDSNYDYCNIVCEKNSFKIKNNTCICSNGKKYSINK